MHRRGLDMCVDPLEAAPWRLLSAAAAGQSVAEAIAQVETRDHDSDSERALDAIRTSFARGWIVGVEPVVAAVESHSVDIRSFND